MLADIYTGIYSTSMNEKHQDTKISLYPFGGEKSYVDFHDEKLPSSLLSQYFPGHLDGRFYGC